MKLFRFCLFSAVRASDIILNIKLFLFIFWLHFKFNIFVYLVLSIVIYIQHTFVIRIHVRYLHGITKKWSNTHTIQTADSINKIYLSPNKLRQKKNENRKFNTYYEIVFCLPSTSRAYNKFLECYLQNYSQLHRS